MLIITQDDVTWREFDLGRLSDELAAAGLPRPMRSERHLPTETLRAEFDADEADRAAILQVFEAHDPDAPSPVEAAAKEARAARAAALDVIRTKAAQDPAFAALLTVLEIDT